MATGKITIGNVCFLIDKNKNEILFLERFFEPMKDLFTGVGGKTNFDEDIHTSCLREINEETGLNAKNLKLKGIIKTILSGHDSSWILFIYTSSEFYGKQIDCPEGKLHWVGINDVEKLNLIGFIREIMPFVLNEDSIIEGTITHDLTGTVLSKKIIEIQ
ncbi:hypothetical protein PbJCM13498_34220 [Prolixibacter bellariivorans]|uniref:Nudix hydrolase domain-containing protein n=2 Tax=Prolixibacter bellariivorans TaxID=314319 RepID=A0A5M4B320_9BACT|nr:NUDIX domain-containing protein [Prolixibacter bellariivorans]GET34559.1 hypothetical protein PbJCM13498_34220 [Prolixibacter bellariivorans]